MKAGHIEEAMKFLSIHSWAYRIDVNMEDNGLGQPSKLSLGLLDVLPMQVLNGEDIGSEKMECIFNSPRSSKAS